MSIPLDKLYYYIESAARDIRGDDILIYRFYPHGSKNLDDLKPLQSLSENFEILPAIYCHDQEPLNFEFYKDKTKLEYNIVSKYNCHPVNLRQFSSIYDKSILIHSELRSVDLNKYINNNFIPVYYWSHAVIARDWYRYVYYEKLNKKIKKLFLIYNRAWEGTREYRLKFIDLLIQYNMINVCHTTFNAVDPDTNNHYSQHQYVNKSWMPTNVLEDYNIDPSLAPSSASADYDIDDYNSTAFEVVLETLFDDDRIQLTEKILRPIALGQPFLLASTHGSLEYLRSYGFKTFNSIIDETYDTIKDPVLRLNAIVKCMKTISDWSQDEQALKISAANKIAEFNKQHFFSDAFFNQIITELQINLRNGIIEQENTNTGSVFLNLIKRLYKHPEIRDFIAKNYKNIDSTISKAKKYYTRSLQQK